MIRWNVYVPLLAVFATAPAAAQINQPVTAAASSVTAQQIEVCTQKTSNIIFPAPIKSVDRGSADILVQKPQGVENVLKLKAARGRFPETNLTVITGDGHFYAFTVTYNASPKQLVLEPGTAYAGNSNRHFDKAVFSDAANDASLIRRLEAQASVTKRNIRHVNDKTGGIRASVRGLYTGNDMFFFKIVLDNRSNIDYDIQSVRLFMEDRKKIKRTSSQELPVELLSITGDSKQVAAQKTGVIIVAVQKQTIAKDKELLVEIIEKGAGRNMVCTLNARTLLKAKPITPVPADIAPTH